MELFFFNMTYWTAFKGKNLLPSGAVFSFNNCPHSERGYIEEASCLFIFIQM